MNRKMQFALLAAANLLAGCGGSGSGPNSNQLASDPPVPPIPKSIYYHSLATIGVGEAGVATDLLFVYFDPPSQDPNPHAYIESVTRDGAAAEAEDLKDGQVVELLGKIDGFFGTATLDIQTAVAGPVESVDVAHAWLTVAGQRVHLFGTVGDVVNLAGISVGERITASGYFTADGQIVATRIDRDTEAGPIVLRGVLTENQNHEISIGQLQIDLSSSIREGFPGGSPLPGDAVLVFADQPPVGGILTVQIARYAGGDWINNQPQNAERLSKLVGFVTDSRSTTDFDIAGHAYLPNFCGACNELSRPVPAGTFVATVEQNGAALLDSPVGGSTVLIGPIDSIDLTGASLSVLGFQIQTSPMTRIVQAAESPLDAEALRIDEFNVGDTVTVAGSLRQAPEDFLYARLLALDGQGMRIQADYYDLVVANRAIEFRGRIISTDATTVVTSCYYDACETKDQSWLFSNMTPRYEDYIFWTIDIDPAAVPLRAIAVSVEAHD